jgi:hypothetical protein
LQYSLKFRSPLDDGKSVRGIQPGGKSIAGGGKFVREFSVKAFVSILLACQLSIGSAASPAIGVAIARGAFQIDDSRVAGNGTLFDGTTIETGKSTSELQIHGGVRMHLASSTRGRVYRDRLILERGEGQMSGGSAYRIEAHNLRIAPERDDAVARVSLSENNRILVAAVMGNLRVSNAAGVTIANVENGRAVELEMQGAGAAAPSTITGCVQKKESHFILFEDTAKVNLEVLGAGVDKHVGQKVEVTGVVSPAQGAAPQVVHASSLKVVAKKCSIGPAAATAGGAAAGGAAAGGAAAGGAGAGAATAAGIGIATKAVIAGVVVAAAGTGAAVGLTGLPGQEESQPSISR